METIILKLFNMSINAGWLILAILILRLLLRKARTPAWISCMLWAMVGVRLVCPFSLESIFSLLPSKEVIPREIALSPAPSVTSGVGFVDNMVNPVLRRSFTPTPAASANPLQIWLFLAGVLWAAGAGILLLYAAFSAFRLYLKLRTALRLEGHVYVSEFIDIPFLFGTIRPRIYLPASLPEEMRPPIIAHEQAHLERLDHFWKLFAFLLLAVYWFHPLCWPAYFLFCRDIETACDEKVIRDYDSRQKRLYSEALLTCSQKTHKRSVCPLAFGEVNVKERIRSVLHYKKPAFWVIAAAILLCVIAAVCFLTDPVDHTPGEPSQTRSENNGNPPSPGNLSESNVHNAASLSELEQPGDQDPADSREDALEEDPSALTAPQQLAWQWAEAFVNRDGNAIASMASDETIADLKDRELLSGPEGQRGFGMSSPWPVNPETDILLCDYDDTQARINYYAWTSDPHVTVWRETLSYELREGRYVVTGEELLFLDDISSAEEFALAYGNPPAIDDSPISYLASGAWEDLNKTALLSSSSAYLPLFEPESAAVNLLNLSDDPAKVTVNRLLSEESDPLGLEIRFADGDNPIRISMSRPGGDPGIWVPQDYRVSPLYRFSQLDWDEIRSRNLSVTQDPDWSDILCLARFPEQDITVYGYNDEECMGQGVAIEAGGKVNYFDWSYTSPQTILPRFYWNDEALQLQAGLHIYTGTGASAEELHVLQEYDDGTLQDNVLEFNDYADLLHNRIRYAYDKETGILTLSDRSDQKQLAAVNIDGAEKVDPELGAISAFHLGENISLRIETGYFPDNASIAEYEGMPVLEAEILLLEQDGYIRFDIGEITVVNSF